MIKAALVSACASAVVAVASAGPSAAQLDPEDENYYGKFIFEEQYQRSHEIFGGITVAVFVIVAAIVWARDIAKIWDCFGQTNLKDNGIVGSGLSRSLTTMSASYAGAQVDPSRPTPSGAFGG
ncbi:hypothetical protein T484DRAFT_1974613 [Baffinella frigidus]|nr:hypothetical protein T484DRAFT_1974613 [Cryptophyta sp. CCMP2293]|mmetsp:Transcript_30015/g.71448  ORF Transcript_30015/g.71448 Transcript_30015/m.71448 type:complete len:123 (-) Transcript_30015:89-457(-)